MRSGEYFLARISIRQATSRSLRWVPSDRMPYQKIDPIDIAQATVDEVFTMYSTAYGGLGDPLNVQEPGALFEHDRWVLIEDAGGALVGFALFKTTSHGVKMCVSATDGSRPAKAGLKALLRRVFNVDGVYAEVSDPVESIVKDHAPHVPVDVAAEVLSPKTIVSAGDGYHYERQISNVGSRTKLMVGKPY